MSFLASEVFWLSDILLLSPILLSMCHYSPAIQKTHCPLFFGELNDRSELPAEHNVGDLDH